LVGTVLTEPGLTYNIGDIPFALIVLEPHRALLYLHIWNEALDRDDPDNSEVTFFGAVELTPTAISPFVSKILCPKTTFNIFAPNRQGYIHTESSSYQDLKPGSHVLHIHDIRHRWGPSIKTCQYKTLKLLDSTGGHRDRIWGTIIMDKTTNFGIALTSPQYTTLNSRDSPGLEVRVLGRRGEFVPDLDGDNVVVPDRVYRKVARAFSAPLSSIRSTPTRLNVVLRNAARGNVTLELVSYATLACM
jgi:hypothetical protein